MPSYFPLESRILSREECVTLVERIFSLTRGGGKTHVQVTSDWTGELRWARNRAAITADRRNDVLRMSRTLHGWESTEVELNQLDDAALLAAIRTAERLGCFGQEVTSLALDCDPTFPAPPAVHIWSDATWQQTPEARGTIAASLMDVAEQAGMLSAGYLKVAARGTAQIDNKGLNLYTPQTFAQCSMTVRDPSGGGSGWAGASSYDWTRFDPARLAQTALDKCLASRNPVAVEPGRYTVILEPQAVWDLIGNMFIARESDEDPQVPNPWYSHVATVPGPIPGSRTTLSFSRLGEHLIDERLSIRFDPTDPDLGVMPYGENGEPLQPMDVIEHGVVRDIMYSRYYALETLHTDRALLSAGVSMSGGDTSLAEMIATTKRGILVTRLWGVGTLYAPSMLMSGYTRDGVWLIENGKISHPVKNFRFTESPFFVLNSVEQIGPAIPVFSPERPAKVPLLKVKDFSFTSLADAV